MEVKHTEIHHTYFGDTWQSFFDPRMEGGFFELLVFAFKASIFVAVFWVVTGSVLHVILAQELDIIQQRCTIIKGIITCDLEHGNNSNGR